MSTILDFHLVVDRIAQGRSMRFATVVAECPVGHTRRSSGQFSLRKVEESQGLWRTDGVPYRFSGSVEDGFHLARDVHVGTIPTDEALGLSLFRLLFPQGSSSLELLEKSCVKLRGDAYLRLRLDLHPCLSRLPWELLECPVNYSEAISIRRRPLFIIRYFGNIQRTQMSQRIAGAKPHVVIVVANPRGSSSPEVSESFDRELTNSWDAFQRLGDQVECHVIEEDATLGRLLKLVRHLRRSSSQIIGFHFIGHGDVDGRGVFFVGEDENRGVQKIYAEDLRDVFVEAPATRWVILNACWTGNEPFGRPLAGLATSLTQLNDVPTVIAHQRPVDTMDAEKLAADFYEQVLGEGRPVSEVVRSVRARSRNPSSLVVLARAVGGKIQDFIRLDRKAKKPPKGSAPVPSNSASSHPVDPHGQPPWKPEPGGMILVSAGPFRKGLEPQQIETLVARICDRGSNLDPRSVRRALSAEPMTTIDLPAFLIDPAPVTNMQFREFVEATQYRTDAERAGDPQNWRSHDLPEKADHPVAYVSYNDAEAYCQWAGKRLPTSDQWKKAYRGGDGRNYPWGDHFDPAKCNAGESGWGAGTPVGTFPDGASPYGCLDMLGNVEEWTATAGSGAGKREVLGGSWAMRCELYGLPVLHRLAWPGFYSSDLGFRCVRDTLPEER